MNIDFSGPHKCKCGKFIDHNRQALKLDSCFRCSKTEVLKQIARARAAEQGRVLSLANEISYGNY